MTRLPHAHREPVMQAHAVVDPMTHRELKVWLLLAAGFLLAVVVGAPKP